MKLTKLEIKGFKSFGDKITINFNEGVTAIVGPNGCGKSNVVDAIRWVLGEQSTKTLRSEKMENIIFNGTKNRKPANLAEVSLTFNNNKNILPTEFTTVTITRKLYRTGESEYRLNDVKCRLKDITDLFLDTGIGADTYSIIELKMIDEIIANKDNSRRALFEEASGISKYKVRKKQTLSKLKDTEADLSRVDDLLYEITKNLKSLENQAKKADKYFQLKEEYKQASIGLAYYRLDSFSTDLTSLSEKEKELQQSLNSTLEQIDVKEKELRTGREEILSKEKSLAAQQKTTNEFNNKIRAYESEKKIKNERLHHLKERESRITAEFNLDKQQLTNVEYTIKRLNEEIYEEQAKLDVAQHDIQKNKTEVEELKGQQQTAKNKLDRFVQENNELQNKIYKVEKDIAVLNIQKESLEQESLRNISDASSKAEELSQFNIAVADLQGKLDAQQQQYDDAVRIENDLNRQIEQAEVQLQETRSLLSKESRLVDAKQNEYNLTKSLVDNLEGFPESIKFLRKNAGWPKSYPLFSDILFCQEEYRVAIENYLESVMNHYVVDTKQDAVQAIQLLSDASRGRANFFVLESVIDKKDSDFIVPENMIPAMQVIKVDKKYEKLCLQLLNNVYLLKSDAPKALDIDLPHDEMVILHHEGKFSKHKLGLSGGSVGLFEGKRIGRAKNLENLAKEIKELNERIAELQHTEAELVDKIASLKLQSQKEIIDEIRIQLARIQNEWTSVKTKQEQYQAFISNSQNRKQDIEKRLAEIAEELTKAEPELKILKVEVDERQKQLADLQAAYQELNEIVQEKSTAYNQENIRLHQQQNKVSGIQKDLEYRESQKEALELRINKNNAEMEQIKVDMKDALTFTDNNDNDLKELYEQRESLEKALHDMEEEFYAFRKRLNDLEEEVATLRKSKDQLDYLITEVKDKKTTLQIDLNSLKERLSVEFNIDIKELLEGDLPEIEHSQEELGSMCTRLKKQLDEFGTINPMAKEAYDEITQRYDFINKEKNDLLEAKASLMSTIEEIDGSANEKFMNAFNTVRDNFIKVFRSLFNEEDSCDLILSDPANPLDSDIDIIARPKGKRPLSINQLSGGEKTLTSTALLFSLYLLKPAPFCIFDEVDAPLDDTNIDKFNNIIKEFSNQSQFIVVSHNKRTIASTDIIYGVTMVEQGISRVVPVDLREVA
ncbi:chromosome segregation protein SMC [Sphingobacterium litopenaei]|uniref:Chromosome partition protein Smc n=1 Tax=Sphingobacterium litopenaei TaxID=2763500 RepID=A0ABR7YG10_9SPHI|nr:chromosome segregation protein SMC [Sphingobacterium litopenaei]MBD1430256.1 chromosome segregation protein SMC [Sphingobacterium litopenaei]